MAVRRKLRLVRVFSGFAAGLVCLLGALVAVSFVIPIDEVVEAHGHVESGASYNVRSSSDGYIEEVKVKDGAIVQRGEPLAVLVNESLADQITQSRLSLRQLERERDEAAGRLQYLVRSAQPTEQDKTRISIDKMRLSLEAAAAQTQSQQTEATRSSALLDRGLVSKKQSDYARLQAQLAQVKEAEDKMTLAGMERDFAALRDRQGEEIKRVRSELARLETEIDKAKLSLSGLEKKQSSSTINAPAAGVMLFGEQREKMAGRFIKTGETVGELVDGQSLIFLAEIPENDVRKLHEKQNVHLELNALPYQKFKVFNGSIEEISLEAERDKVTGVAAYKAKIKLDDPWVDLSEEGQNGRFALKPGFSGVARIIVRPDMRFISWLGKQLFGGNS